MDGTRWTAGGPLCNPALAENAVVASRFGSDGRRYWPTHERAQLARLANQTQTDKKTMTVTTVTSQTSDIRASKEVFFIGAEEELGIEARAREGVQNLIVFKCKTVFLTFFTPKPCP